MNLKMDPGEYLTNVLSFNNYAIIHYEYFEAERPSSSGLTKKHLQRLELGWRQDGRLVHYDSLREGLWIFQGSTSKSLGVSVKDSELGNLNLEIRGVGLVQRDKGVYEPASLVRSKAVAPNTMATPSSSSSPSSSMEASLRNAQALNARSVQQNLGLSVSHELPMPSPTSRSTNSSDMSASLKDIHEYFISSVLGSLVYFLCRQQNCIPLNSRTLILTTPNMTSSPIELATLDISLTSLGVVVVKAHCDVALGLQSLATLSKPGKISETSVGASLWLAPSGNAARFYSMFDDVKVEDSTSVLQFQGDSANGQANFPAASTIKSWQSKCLDWLSTKGLNSSDLEAGGWLYVQIIGGISPYLNLDNQTTPAAEDLAIIPWPALLCFQTSITAREAQQIDAISDIPRDPLAFAEEWFKGRDERSGLLLKRQRDRQAAEALSREQADVEARNLQSHIYSPAALRRGSNAGAMYPTPPDAPHPIGATPTFDGNVSTPGNHNVFVPHDSGASASTTVGADGDVDMWSSAKKERTSSAVQFTDSGAENAHMFGDPLDVDVFDGDIIEADFDFFDVPDTEPAAHNTPSPTIPALPVAQEAVTKEEEMTLDRRISSDHIQLDSIEENFQIIPDADPIPFFKSPVTEITSLHAGSTQMDVDIANNPHQRRIPVIPFNQETVFNRLAQKHTHQGCSTLSRRSSLFDKIPFENSVMSVNAKYGSQGQFNVTVQKKISTIDKASELPLTGYLSDRRKARVSRNDSAFTPHILVEEAPIKQVTDEPMDYLVDSDGYSQISEQDDTSNTTEGPSPISKLGSKRRWDIDDSDDIGSSFNALAMELDQPVGTPQSINGSQIPLLDADPADWSLTTYFTTPEPDIQFNILSDAERIATAQILADQAVFGTFSIPGTTITDIPTKLEKVCTTRQLMHNLAKAASACLRDPTACSLRSFIDIQGIPVLNQGLRLPPRPMAPRGPNGLEPNRPNNPFQLPPPQLEVRRADSKLSILPSAVNFWENLGLGPSQGNKDVNAVCVHPNIGGVSMSSGIFLDQMRSVYESSRFGSHNKVFSKEVPNGLVAYSLDPLQHHRQHYAAALKETTAQLCKLLQSLTVGDTNFVVYFVYPNDNGTLLVQICSAFQHLFNLYRKALSERRVNMANELVLQLIPLDFIASPTTLAVPSPNDYFHIAMEVYDRCFDFDSLSSSPAIMLDRPLPKMIDFKLNSTSSASVLQENTCLHVAYAQSLDDRWVTAAWTDNRGTQQMTASYCLGRKNEPLSTPFSQVATEIWETTIDYISSKKIHWRLMVVKVGAMDSSELEVWTHLASNETNAQASLTLITVHTDPSLRLLPAATVLTPSSTAASSVITPVSTPQGFQSSNVPSDTANTPANAADAPLEPDGDSRLIDVTDQSWGAVLGHRLNNSNSLVELNLALISGYLIKRGGANNDPPVVMEVNIVHSEVIGNPRTFHESLLREVLGYYRGLGSLARVRGVVNSVEDVRPWHIAAAEKAVKALYMLM